jgi:hypothetical protein
MGLQMSKKNIFLFVMISLNYKCSKDAKTGLGLVRGCLVQILSQYLETQVGGQSPAVGLHYGLRTWSGKFVRK